MPHDLIPALIFAIPLLAIWTKHKRRMAELELVNRPSAADTEEMAAQIRRLRELEERVKVLERIITDNRRSAGLAEEIEALR